MRYHVLVDRTEQVHKCTILPLAGHASLDIIRFERGLPIQPLPAEYLLHPDGESLEKLVPTPGVKASLAAIDCRWKRLSSIMFHMEKPLPRLVRIPDGFVTAYPRRNKKGKDPDSGLATIEAVFIGAALLGHWDTSLLSKYFFAEEFLRVNREAFAAYGLRTWH